MIARFLAFFVAILIGTHTIQAEIEVGSSGLPIPRFVSLAATQAYMRTGPGRQYPIDWVYSRRGLPLEVVDEDGPWRQVRDESGITGWMHVSLLSGRRTALITGKLRKLYREATAAAPVRLTADPGVIGEIVSCENIWCELEIDGTSAWIERRHLWGIYANEVID